MTFAGLPLGSAVAAEADDHNYRLNVPADKWLSVSEVIEKLNNQGYVVTKIEADDRVSEFGATNSAGVRVERHANPATDEVLTGYDD